jgi:choline dehydrogenase-like flavoprotein
VLELAPLRRLFLGRSTMDVNALLADEGSMRDLVREQASPQLHPLGTCRMGTADDPGAVVDVAGRVHGVDALRVVDASIFPTITRGYTHFLVLMAAEKIADAVKADRRAASPRIASVPRQTGG